MAVASKSYDFLIKLLLIGDSGVGKSVLLSKFDDDTSEMIPDFIATIGIDFRVKTLTLDERVVKLQIWDTAGQERFRTITSAYYRGAHGILLVYDVTNRASFFAIRDWIANARRYGSEDTQLMLVGNKCDENTRVVSTTEGQALAEAFMMPFLECSPRTGKNVKLVFEGLTQIILRQRFPLPVWHQVRRTDLRMFCIHKLASLENGKILSSPSFRQIPDHIQTEIHDVIATHRRIQKPQSQPVSLLNRFLRVFQQ
eukprot:TRINITY_DN1110_c0_g2_i1.p1 TRINITY_DN1110_c0_g2~~TRINITY_DN1110_c0_g2_i1.p1  ORF type:complete len:255 (+),score=51.96 TRINITY_DN1110_c0_g2_i1:661-1425(+)